MNAKGKRTLAIYPGSFDPITNGHISIIQRGLAIFDEIIVAVAVNASKKPLFDIPERMDLIEQCLNHNVRIEVDTFDGLLVDYAESKGAGVVVRGMRALSDFEFEFQMALMNRKLNRNIQTVFMMTDYRWLYVSSTIIKEAASLGGSVTGMVSPLVERAMKRKFGFEESIKA
jgi:pantetheine-phosphate adenylyltransferase